MEKLTRSAKFNIGQLVTHKLFNYRGVVIDVDPVFLGTDEWYKQVALCRPPRDNPWYHVLVHNAVHETYVAERNLEADDSGQEILNPLVDIIFAQFCNGVYVKKHQAN